MSPLGLPGFKCVQPGLEALAHPLQHAGEVRVVESNHLRAVAPPRGRRQILPLCFCEVVRGEAQPQVPVHVRALVLLGLHGVEQLQQLSHVGRQSPSSPGVKLVLQTTLPVLPAITRQPGFLWFVVRDSCVERLFVCTSASSLIMMSSHCPAVPLLEDPRALVAQQPQLRAAVGGRAVVGPLSLEGVSQMVYILPERLQHSSVQHLTSSCEGFEV